MPREAIVFTKKQKAVFIGALREYIEKHAGRETHDSYLPVVRQTLRDFERTNSRYMTPSQSRKVWSAVWLSSDEWKSIYDLEDRIRKPWDDGKTYDIVFK